MNSMTVIVKFCTIRLLAKFWLNYVNQRDGTHGRDSFISQHSAVDQGFNHVIGLSSEYCTDSLDANETGKNALHRIPSIFKLFV